MAEFTAADVTKLRDLTGAGMMDCKNALTDADGDHDQAVELLRISGAAKAAKRGAERETSNGIVANDANALIELLCETDFVAKSADFQALATAIAVAANSAQVGDQAGVLALSLPQGGTVAEAIAGIAAVIGEKIELGRTAVLPAPVSVYMHRRASDLPPQVGVMVAYQGSEEAARGTAMQAAAMKPLYVSRDEVPADVIETERRVAEAKAIEDGKPEAALPKIIEGRVGAYFKDYCLLEQDSVTDPKKNVAAVLKDAGTTVTAFVRFDVGQG